VILQVLQAKSNCDIGCINMISKSGAMAAVTIRKLPDEVHAILKRRAKEKGRSTEAEIRETLISATQPAARQVGFGTELHEFWKKQGSPEFILPPRTGEARIVDFSGPEFGSDDL
jgi:antitoxin FitA